MSYWRGTVNRPIVKGWKCKICDEDSSWLVWGLFNGECRCERCHHVYTMRQNNDILTTPLSLLREDYEKAAYFGWQERHTPMDHWTEEFWDEMKAKAKRNS